MQIETKFKSDDIVYIIKPYVAYNSSNIVCPACHGSGKIAIHDAKFDCRTRFNGGKNSYECHDGKLVHCSRKWRMCNHWYRIAYASIEVEDDDVYISYLMDDDGEYDESQCFASKEEAQAACDLKNGGN